MQLDESDRVKNIFWANASCRGAYQDFGDCVTFDTTYKTNKYHMPLGVFVGTNNHFQATIFAFSLIRDEDADSFRWLFKTFLKCMRGKAPTCILTGTTTKKPNPKPTPKKKENNTVKMLCQFYLYICTTISWPLWVYFLISRRVPGNGFGDPRCFQEHSTWAMPLAHYEEVQGTPRVPVRPPQNL